MKDILILEGGDARSMTDVRKIKTRLSDGSQTLWIPQDECPKYGKYANVTITKEGIFTAPFDGFLTVVVNIPETTSVTGTEDGVQVVYTVNEEGYLVSEEVT